MPCMDVKLNRTVHACISISLSTAKLVRGSHEHKQQGVNLYCIKSSSRLAPRMDTVTLFPGTVSLKTLPLSQ